MRLNINAHLMLMFTKNAKEDIVLHETKRIMLFNRNQHFLCFDRCLQTVIISILMNQENKAILLCS